MVILVLWLLVLFSFLGNTADEFLSPTMSGLSDVLRLPHNLAGVTLLAFANGAPDLAASVSSITGASPTLGVGALVGAALFVPVTVLGIIAVVKPGFRVTRRPFVRDVGFLLITIVCMLIFFALGELSLVPAILFFSLYMAYVGTVVVSRFIYLKGKARRAGRSGLDAVNDDGTLADIDGSGDDENALLTGESSMTEIMHTAGADEALDSLAGIVSSTDVRMTASELKRTNTLMPDEMDLQMLNAGDNIFHRVLVHLYLRTEWHEKDTVERVSFVLKSPLMLLCMLTVPLVGEENYSRDMSALYFVFSPLFVLSAFGFIGLHVGEVPVGLAAAVLIVLVGPILSVAYLKVTAAEPGKPRWTLLQLFMSFFTAIAWIYVIANELVNLLQTFGLVIGLSPDLLGLTVLAWGNSIGDLVSNVAVARMGFPQMGVAAAFGSPLLNLLVGLGASSIIVNVRDSAPLSLVAVEPIVIVGAAMLALALTANLVVVPLCKFRVVRPYGFVLIGVYAVYFVIVVVSQVVGAVQDKD